MTSRSAAIQHAIRLLAETALEHDYAAAWEEWDASGERTSCAPALPDTVLKDLDDALRLHLADRDAGPGWRGGSS